jgi:exodeoxyribonuclease VII small subunit
MSKNKLSYEEAIMEIEKVVAELENDEMEVDALAGKVKLAIDLIKQCQTKLRNTENDLFKVLDSPNKEE